MVSIAVIHARALVPTLIGLAVIIWSRRIATALVTPARTLANALHAPWLASWALLLHRHGLDRRILRVWGLFLFAVGALDLLGA